MRQQHLHYLPPWRGSPHGVEALPNVLPLHRPSFTTAHLTQYLSWHRLAGSTGAPKGVLCCHEGLVNAMDFEISMRRKCSLGKDDPVIQAMAVFADMSGEFMLRDFW